MDRCAMLVDAGYLLGAAGTLLVGSPDRGPLQTDYPGLVQALIVEAELQTGMPVFRLLWYDGAFNSRPTPEHRALRVLPDVKVRLGELVQRGERVEQKGVDSYLQRDLTVLSRNHAVADVVLVGGDEDLRRALEEAQDYGIRVHLWGVEAAAPEYNQSQSLIAEADRRWIIPGHWVRRFVRVREQAPPVSTDGVLIAKDLLETDAVWAQAAPPQPTANPPQASAAATPADLARLAAAYGKNPTTAARPAPTGRGWEVRPAEHDVPRLRDLTNSRQTWEDNEQDAIDTTSNPAGVGGRFGARWVSRATREQRAALLELHPFTPRHLDGELLRYAEHTGIDTWEDDVAKRAVRDGFWDSLLATREGEIRA